jgi:hypothetical protein
MTTTPAEPAPVPALATHEDVAKLTGQTFDAAQQARLTLYLAAASRMLREAAGWHLYPVIGEDVTLDGSGAASQLLPTMRLVELLGVTENGVALDVAGGVEWSADGYLRKLNGAPWTRRLRGVRASIRHGYPVLEDVQRLACELAARALHVSKAPGVSQINTGPFGAKFELSPLTADELDVLTPYSLGG